MSDKVALITGITGQDGAYLAKFLLGKGYKVFGVYRRVSSPNFWRLQTLGIYEKAHLISGDMTDMASLLEALTVARPSEGYTQAAQSLLGASFGEALMTADGHGIATTRVLEAI